jgi:hypothetical protein
MIGWKLFLENPMGIGTGAFRARSAGFYDPALERSYSRGKAAHSGWVQILAENGVIGAGVLIVYVTSFTWSGFLRRRYHGLLAAGFIVSGSIAIRLVAVDFSELGNWWLVGGAIFLFYKVARPTRFHGVFPSGFRQQNVWCYLVVTNPDHKRHYRRVQLEALLKQYFDGVYVRYACPDGALRRWSQRFVVCTQTADHYAQRWLGSLTSTGPRVRTSRLWLTVRNICLRLPRIPMAHGSPVIT